MADAVELKVCIRCRPFSVKDRAGIILEQLGETKGEARIVNAEQERNVSAATLNGRGRHQTGRGGDD